MAIVTPLQTSGAIMAGGLVLTIVLTVVTVLLPMTLKPVERCAARAHVISLMTYGAITAVGPALITALTVQWIPRPVALSVQRVPVIRL